jgi:hypothetical protein
MAAGRSATATWPSRQGARLVDEPGGEHGLGAGGDARLDVFERRIEK